MPYILANRRHTLFLEHPVYTEENLWECMTEGELNYYVSRLINSYVISHGGINYKNINAVIGVLECAKLEAYRRLAVDYENEKKEKNGEVFTCLEIKS